MRFADAQRLDQLAAVADLPTGPPDPAAQTAPVLTVDARLEQMRVAITGQETPIGPGMQNRTIRFRTDAVENEVVSLKATVATLTDLLSATRADLLPRLQLTEAELRRNFTEDAAQAASQERDRTKQEALAAKQQVAETTLALVQARQQQDEAATTSLQQQLATAQAALTSTTALATEARTIAQAARDLANANQIALNTLNGRFRLKRLAIPTIGINATATLNVVWDTPFVDDNYNAVAQVEGLALLGLAADVTARTKEGCTVQLKNGLGLTITLASATVSITATHY